MSRWSDYSPERRAELNARRKAHHAAHREQHKAIMHQNYLDNRVAYLSRAKRYHDANRDKILAYGRNVGRFRKYGLTREMFDEHLDAQEDACAFCGLQLSKNISDIAIDHDHATGLFRGLVHNSCNRAIGMGEPHLEGYLAAAAL